MNAQWWDATRERRLLLQRCAAGHLQHPPGAVCRVCGAPPSGWAESTGTGTVDAATTVHRAPAPEFVPPYVIARIRLDDGPILLATCDTEVIGTPVTVAWQDLPDGRALPVFVTKE